MKKSSLTYHKKILAVYGLGNVGGPLAAAWLRAGFKIIAVDISKKLLSDITKGKSHKREHLVSETFSDALKKGKLSLTTDGVTASKQSKIKIVAVPVDIKKNKIDFSALISVTNNID